MSQTPPFLVMQYVLDLLDDVFARRAARALTEKDNIALKEFVGQVLLTQRLNMVRTSQDAQALWDVIRANEAVVDFVLNLSADLQLAFDLGNLPFDKFVESLAKAYGQNHHGNGSAIDQDLRERLPKSKDLNELYMANPWLVALLLIGMRGLAVLNHIPNLPKSGNT